MKISSYRNAPRLTIPVWYKDNRSFKTAVYKITIEAEEATDQEIKDEELSTKKFIDYGSGSCHGFLMYPAGSECFC